MVTRSVSRACHILGGVVTMLGTPAAAASFNTPIQHVIIIMQENRSFDSYFGTYHGADGIPADTCIPLSVANPQAGCVVPFHDVHDSSVGGPHDEVAAQYDLDDGISANKMDGFVDKQIQSVAGICKAQPTGYFCMDQTAHNRHDVAGYHTAEEIPNYWAYAKHFVLQDRMFEGVRAWSGPAHLDLASEWWATCGDPRTLSTCVSGGVHYNVNQTVNGKPYYPWISLFQLLDINAVDWKVYLGAGSEPDCDDAALTCDPVVQLPTVPSIWNVAPGFAYVAAKGSAYIQAHNPSVDQFLLDVAHGTLPHVSWIFPSLDNSEHPGNSGVTAGEMYVTSLVNAVMQSAYWDSTAIYISWDDWGGFYDHVVPPNVDRNTTAHPIQGFGLRVPGLMLSAYARAGFIDHQTLSFENYAILFENLFMHGARLDPVALGQPDNRPDIRDEIRSVTFPDGSTQPVGDLIREFDFRQTPLKPLVLTTHIPTNIRKFCRKAPADFGIQCQRPQVSVEWNAVAVQSGAQPVTFVYHVQRDGAELAACTGTGTSCLDMPGSGDHFYKVYSVDPGGVVSPLSPAAEANEP